MKKLIKTHRNFFLLFFLWLIVGFILMITIDKVSLQKLLNEKHFLFADYFFKYLTFLGDGGFVVLVAVLSIFRSFRFFLFILFAYLSSGLITQILKRLFFYEINRPNYVLNEMGFSVPQIEGVILRNHHSFPSGHTTSIFALIFSLLLLLGKIKNNYTQQTLFFFVALTVGFSRIYLNQHFLPDVYVGSIIGTFSCLIPFFLFQKLKNNWLDKPIHKVVKFNKKNHH